MRTISCTMLVAAALLVGCGPAQPPPEDPADPEPPPVAEPTDEPTTTDPGPADPAAPPEDPATVGPGDAPAAPDPAETQALLERKCAACHGLDKLAPVQADRDGWAAIVERMVGQGAVLTDAERAELVEYLAARSAP